MDHRSLFCAYVQPTEPRDAERLPIMIATDDQGLTTFSMATSYTDRGQVALSKCHLHVSTPFVAKSPGRV